MLSFLGYAINKKDVKDVEALKKALTVMPVNPAMGLKTNVKYTFWKESESRFFLPKYFGIERFGLPEATHFPYVISTPTSPDAWLFKGELRSHQIAPVEAYLNSKIDGVLALPCGFGKTLCCLYIASVLKVKTLVIVNEEDLGEQWKQRAATFLPNLKVGWIQRDKCEINESDLVIGMLQSLSMRKYDAKELGKFGFVVVDECHIIGSEVYTKCLQNLCAPRMLGLSATPRRKDGLTDVIHWFLGPIIYSLKREKDSEVRVEVCPFKDSSPDYTRVQTAIVGGKEVIAAAAMLSQIATWKPRNEFIVTIILKFLEDADRQILVISDRREGQLEEIYDLLREKGCDSVGYYVGRKGTVKAEHRKKIEESMTSRVVLATYAKAKQGLDIPTLNTLIMASPQPDVEQTTGRILRELPANRKTVPVIVDITDPQHSNYARQYKQRKKYYKDMGYTIVEQQMEKEKEKETILSFLN